MRAEIGDTIRTTSGREFVVMRTEDLDGIRWVWDNDEPSTIDNVFSVGDYGFPDTNYTITNVDVAGRFRSYCSRFPFSVVGNVRPYDDTTLFCIAGMQQYKEKFSRRDYSGIPTITNIQPCIRMNDFDSIGDSTHMLYFNMMGMFSFDSLSVKDAVDFWMGFLKTLEINVDYVTVHPKMYRRWKRFYEEYDVEVRKSEDCKWSDGGIGGYCTEFFKDDVEIGNIVNPNGDCIDAGFGLERIESFVNISAKKSRNDILKETISVMIRSGYVPGNVKQGYVLRKLLRELYRSGDVMDHQFFLDEVERQKKIVARYEELKSRHGDKPKSWWYDTHGINLDDLK